MSLVIDQPGLLTTVQDLGRPALRSAGVPPNGAADPLALRVANLLLGNDENAACLECALLGPTLHFTRAVRLAITGARVDQLPFAKAFDWPARRPLSLGRFLSRTYAYLAVAGGIGVPLTLASRSTALRSGFGGHEGRALLSGDRLLLGDPPDIAPPSMPAALETFYPERPIRVLPGKDSSDFLRHPFALSPRSDRMGVRLEGPRISISTPSDGPSHPVLPGTVQLPPDGAPIVLLNDAGTLGGYPQVAHVISADLGRLAQLRPGSSVQFESVTLAEAHQVMLRTERSLAMLRYRLSQPSNDAHHRP